MTQRSRLAAAAASAAVSPFPRLPALRSTPAGVVTPPGGVRGRSLLFASSLSIAAGAPHAGEHPSVAVQDGAAQDAAGGGPALVAHTIDAELAGGYQPVVVDLNRDGRLDVIGLSTRLDELAWYENPGWERHVMTTGITRAINAAARDLDGDGIPEVVLAHDFGTTHARSLGILTLLTHTGDPTDLWHAREVDRTPTVHRIRWADVDSTGPPGAGHGAALRPRGRAARVPRRGAGLLVPAGRLDPPHGDRRRAGRGASWPAGEAVGRCGGRRRVHGQLHGRARAPLRGRDWIREQVAAGDPAPWPESGASEVDTGRLGERTFVTTIEPWHGPQVVVYVEDGDEWRRQVIDDIGSGHTIVTADRRRRRARRDRDRRPGRERDALPLRRERCGGRRLVAADPRSDGMSPSGCDIAELSTATAAPT